MSEVVALVPVREGSQRVKSKNFKDFSEGLSLLDLKIKQLKSEGCFDHIYISSDSDLAKAAAEKHNVEFLLREKEMCEEHIRWSTVVEHIVDTIPGDTTVVWALTTAPLFSRFNDALKEYNKSEEHDSLVGVFPTKSFFINKFGKGINFNPGSWHSYSQELETYYEVTGSVFIGRKTDMKKWNYWFGTKPLLFELSNIESIDVDTPDDYLIAQKLYKAQQ